VTRVAGTTQAKPAAKTGRNVAAVLSVGLTLVLVGVGIQLVAGARRRRS
jgi:hypothetical protein